LHPLFIQTLEALEKVTKPNLKLKLTGQSPCTVNDHQCQSKPFVACAYHFP